MMQRFCEHEPAVLEAAGSGCWEPDLRRHIAECPLCADVALVAGFMNIQAEADLSEARLPDAELVWWKLQLKARRAAAEKATQPVAVVEKIACVWGGAVLLASLSLLWPHIRLWGEWITASWVAGSQAGPLLGLAVVSMIAVGAVSVLCAVGLGLYFAWSDR